MMSGIFNKKKRKSQIYLRGISAKQHEQQNAKAKTKIKTIRSN